MKAMGGVTVWGERVSSRERPHEKSEATRLLGKERITCKHIRTRLAYIPLQTT